MRLGQTSIVHFVSKVVASVLGFVATIYIARLLGAEALGIYSLALTIIAWLGIVGNMGVSGAVKKRVSEGEEPGAYAVAGVVLIATLFALLAAVLLTFREQVDAYVGYPATGFVVLMLGVLLGQRYLFSLLDGRHLVHLSGVFSPVKIGGRAALQIAALYLGYEIVGLFGGYVLGYLVVIVLGGAIVLRDLESVAVPGRRHVERLYSYAKFSWLGSLKSQSFNWVDIAVLGFFVSQSFVGYYTAAWNIAAFLIIFGGSLSRTIFPEMSRLSSEDSREAVAELLDSALAYAGIVLVPGLVGGLILGERIMRIYGEGFTRAATVLSILIAACLLQSYQKQITTTLNAIDRPDIAFRVNAVFILSNLVLNVALVTLYGWIGAAIATTIAVAVSLVAGYVSLRTVVDVSVPTGEMARQWIAAGVMGGVVHTGLRIEAAYVDLGHNFALVLFLVGLGAGVYFLTLVGISSRFRQTVVRNLPVAV